MYHPHGRYGKELTIDDAYSLIEQFLAVKDLYASLDGDAINADNYKDYVKPQDVMYIFEAVYTIAEDGRMVRFSVIFGDSALEEPPEDYRGVCIMLQQVTAVS